MSFINEIINTFGIKKVNTFTKYLSILTYHSLGPKGSLCDSLVDERPFGNNDIYITEKIDGSNCRIIFSTNNEGKIDDYLIGSREDLLFAKGDRIINNSLSMVENVLPIAIAIENKNISLKPNHIYGFYGEHFGGNCNGFKNYSNKKTWSFRFFDIFEMPINDVKEILTKDIEIISSWREKGNHPFVSVERLQNICKDLNIPTVPYLKVMNGNDFPIDLQGVYDWLQEYKNTNVILDENYEGPGLSEGVVIRTSDRKNIKKVRFEDYNKTKRLGLIK